MLNSVASTCNVLNLLCKCVVVEGMLLCAIPCRGCASVGPGESALDRCWQLAVSFLSTTPHARVLLVSCLLDSLLSLKVGTADIVVVLCTSMH